MNCDDKICEKDSDKIVVLYENYKICMYKEAYRILKDTQLAEDAKIELEDAVKTRSFLIIICRNIAINMYNRRARLMANSEYIDLFSDDENNEIGSFNCPSSVVISNETLKDVVEAIGELPTIYKDVIILEHFHNYSKKEIAKLLNVNYDTVKKRAERGRKLLVEKLEKKGVTLK